MSGICGSIRLRMCSDGWPTNSFMKSGSGRRTFSMVCVVRKPSCTFRNGVSASSAVRRAISAKSPASCALRAYSTPHPQSATPTTSSWPACTFSDWEVSAREPMWNTIGRRFPEIVYSTSFIRIRPWPDVKLVTRPPATAKPSHVVAALCSDSGSMKASSSPHRFFFPLATSIW